MLYHNKCTIMEQELLTLPEHLSSIPVFGGVRVTRSLVLYACFVNHCLFFCPFSFGHCVVRRSSIYGFWLPLWYLHALLKRGGVILCIMKNQNYRSSYLPIVFSYIFKYNHMNIPAIFLCLPHTRIWISKAICCDLYVVILFEVRDCCSFCFYW
jgi:hypothetical protein